MQRAEDLGVTMFAPRGPVKLDRSSTSTRDSGSRARRRFSQILFSEYLLLYLLAVYLAVAVPFIPGLLSVGNIRGMVSNLLPLLVVSIGQGFVLITAGIDLSVTSVFACSSVAGGLIMTADGGWLAGSPWSVPVGLLAMLLVGASIGWLNGLSITTFKMPPFVVTLSTMTFFSGVAVWVTNSRNIYRLPGLLNTIGQGSIGFVPYALLLTVLLAAVTHVLLKRTVMGRWLYSVGQNPKAAVISGVPVKRTVIFAYVVSGLCATCTTLLLMGRLETASPIIGQRLLLDTIAAPVIGGVSLFGGRGKISGIILGAVFVTLMDNGLNLLGLSYFVIMMAKGALVLFAALLDVRRTALTVNT
jgi:ribose transport system permease protein